MVPVRTAAFITALKAAKIRPRISWGVLSWRMERAGTMKAMFKNPARKKATSTQAKTGKAPMEASKIPKRRRA
jgi:hypothetical protein